MKEPQWLLVTLLFALVLVLPGQPAHAAVPRPDITITRITSQFQDGNWHLVYTVTNVGTANAGAFYIKIKRGNVVEAEFSSTGLAAGVSQPYSRQMPICEFTRTVVIDSRFQIIESNENNNSRTFTNFC